MRAHLPEEREILIIQVQEQINELRNRRVLGVRRIDGWKFVVAGNDQSPGPPPEKGWKPIEPGTHWGEDRPDLTAWFQTVAQVPREFRAKGTFVALHLSMAREGLIYLNGKPFHGVSENHKTFRLIEPRHLGKPVRILVEAYTEAVRHPAPKYHGKFETAEFVQVDETVDSLCWDLRTALDVLRTHPPNSTHHHRMLDLLARTMTDLQPFPSDPMELRESCLSAARNLRAGMKGFPSEAGDGQLLVCGHSHIDTAWLWPLKETKRKCGRTFSSILQLMEVNPEFTFAQGQPQLYQYTKEHYPEVYAKIKKRIAEGRWDPAGPAWVEMDCNLSGGEAIVRQFLYGNRFLEKEFGVRNNVCWLPDAFGYACSLPQILRGCGVDVFVTTKIDWSMITRFPYTTFEWEGIDGTRILAMMPPLNYNGNLIPKDCKQQWEQIRQKDVLEEMLFSFGWGDGGGGPTQEMIETGRRLGDVAGIPKVRFGTITEYFEGVLGSVDRDRLPVWNGELYLELHRACQITQARTKRFNRRMELLLRDAEFLSSLAWMGKRGSPHADFEPIWRDVLTNQFHDILPGSSVESLYRETDEIYRRAEAGVHDLIDRSWRRFEKRIDTRGEGRPLLIFNSLGWDRTDSASMEWKEGSKTSAPSAFDADGTPLPTQMSTDLWGERKLWIDPGPVPAVGVRTIRLLAPSKGRVVETSLDASEEGMENDFFRIRFDGKGMLASVRDKRRGREVLAKGLRGNVLQLFHDHPHMHDAWDYDFNIDENAWVWDDLRSIEVTERGPVRASVEIVRKTEQSTLRQRIVLYSRIPRIDFETKVDWWEKHLLLKAAFPVAVRSPKAVYEIQFGTIERATHESTPFDRARFEVPHHRWMDLSEGDYGVGVANDCKYGSDILGNTMRLSLLRSPVHPDPKADEGLHRFTYSLIPHEGDWRAGKVRVHAAELNSPALCRTARTHPGEIEPTISMISCTAPSLVIETLKREEDGSRLVLRLYESEGRRGRGRVEFGFPIVSAALSDLVERGEKPVRFRKRSVDVDFEPYEIKTLLIGV